MAWVEQTGKRSWRVRYARPTGGHGSVSGFASRKAAEDYAEDLESDSRHGRWLDPDGARTTVGSWVLRWVPTLDVETRSEENYHSYLRNHILPRWHSIPLGDITALAVTSWRKELREHVAASTVACIFTVFSMLLDDAVDERLIPTSPVHRRRRRGWRRDHASSPTERVWALPEHVLRIADQAGVLGGPSAALLVITAAWTGCHWGELAGLQNRSSPPARPPLSNRLVETYSHVASEIEHRLLKTLEQRWQQAQRLRKPVDNRPRRRPAQRAPHTHPALRTTGQRPMMTSRPQARMTVLSRTAHIREANSLPNSSTSVHSNDQRPDRLAIIGQAEDTLLPANAAPQEDSINEWS